MSTGPAVEFRLASPDDIAGIGLLLPDLGGPDFSERFPGKTISAFYRWKYFCNPNGNALVGVAVASGRIVSIVAAVPKRIQVGPDVYLAFELGDFITSLEYRKQGMFSKLIELACAEAGQRGGSFAYVRPNDNSFPILVSRLSFTEVWNIAVRRYFLPSIAIHRRSGVPLGMMRALGTDWLMRKLVVPSSSPSVEVRRVEHFGQELDDLWDELRRDYNFSLVRKSSYLNWRYADSPTQYLLWVAYRNGRIAGYLVGFVSKSELTGHIVDLFCGPKDEATAATLVRTGIDTMLEKGVGSIATWVLPKGDESTCGRILARAFPRVGQPPLHFVVRFLGANLDRSHLPFSGWRLATGDFDGI